jgi:hypothetical protein
MKNTCLSDDKYAVCLLDEEDKRKLFCEMICELRKRTGGIQILDFPEDGEELERNVNILLEINANNKVNSFNADELEKLYRNFIRLKIEQELGREPPAPHF